MGDFDFGGADFGGLGSGYYNIDYGDQSAEQSLFQTQDLYHGYIDTRPQTSLLIEINGVGSSPAPPPPANYTTDIIGGFANAASIGLTGLYNAANAAAAQLPATITQSASTIETQMMNHVLNSPSIAGALVSLGQVAHGFVNNDARSVYTNAASALTGMAIGELAIYALAGATTSVAATAIIVGGLAAGAGLLAAYGAGVIYDNQMGLINDNDGSTLQMRARDMLIQMGLVSQN